MEFMEPFCRRGVLRPHEKLNFMGNAIEPTPPEVPNPEDKEVMEAALTHQFKQLVVNK